MGAFATGTPLVPIGFIAGTITTTSSPQNVLDLIVAQLDANVDRGARNLLIQAGSAACFLGGPSTTGGAMSSTNYGLTLAAGTWQLFTSNFPGSNTPIGSMQVLTASAGSVHVMVW